MSRNGAAAAMLMLSLATLLAPSPTLALTHGTVGCTPLLVTGVPVAEACPPWQVLRNGDFELCDDCVPESGDLPRNWTYVPYAWARASGASWTQRASVEGDSGLALTCGSDGNTVVRADMIRLSSGTDLAWVVHAQGPLDGAATGTVALVSVEFFTASGSPAGGAGYGSYTDSTWVRYDDTATVPPGTEYVSLQLECRSDAPSATITFDAASMRLL